MNRPLIWLLLGGLGICAASLERPAHAAQRPLLVVVEAPAALDADAAEIRRAIGTELGCETVAPTKTTADPPERALIVALDRDQITMSLRAGDAAPVTRSIPTPPERAARLRVIVWLAGNLARDQVSPIVAELVTVPALRPTSEALPAIQPSHGADDATSPPPSPSIEPPPFETTSTTVTTHLNPAPAHRSPWTIGAAAGPAVSTYDLAHSLRQSIFGSWSASSVGDVFSHTGTTWRVELRHQTEGSRLFTGLVLEGAAASDSPGLGTGDSLGAGGVVGSSLQLGRWSLEASFGAGVDLHQQTVEVVVTMMSSTNGFTSSSSQESAMRAGLCAGGTVAVSHPVFESVDAVLSLNAHVSIIDEYDGYLAAMLGLRYNL
jgi:hypothetical protein